MREGMEEGDAPRGARAGAVRPAVGLGPVARPDMTPRDAGTGRRPSAPGVPPLQRVGRSLPVGPGAMMRGSQPRGTAGESYARAAAVPGYATPRTGFGLPSLRRNICPHFYMTGIPGSVPIQAPHLLKALVRQEQTVSRCQLRGGVHMEQGYVYDVCLGSRFNQCVFYEDDLGS